MDAGTPPRQVLKRTAETSGRELEQSLTQLRAVVTDEELLDSYGVNGADLRREVDWSRVWLLP